MEIGENIASSFQMVSTSVKSIKLKNDFVALDELNNFNKTLDVEYDIEAIDLIEDKGYWLGTSLLKVKCEVKKNAKKKIIVEVQIQGVFIENSARAKKDFEDMLNINGCSCLYSVARGLIISITGQALEAGKVVLPMINVFEFNKAKRKKEDNLVSEDAKEGGGN